MVETILSSPFVKDLVLPFLLVFALVFAVLQKSEILGKGKRQVDAIVALVIGLLVVAVGSATDVITGLMPVLAVGLVVLLSFFLLWGFAFKEGSFEVPNAIKWVIAALAALAVIVTVLYFTGSWDYLKELISGSGSSIVGNIVFLVLVVLAVFVVIGFGGKSKKD